MVSQSDEELEVCRNMQKVQRDAFLWANPEFRISEKYVKLRAIFLKAQAHPWYSKFLSFVWVELRIMTWLGMVDKSDVEKLKAEFGG